MMNVILLEKMANLGNLGDIVRVRPGYARNFLFRQKKACMATPKLKAEFEARRAALEQVQAERLTASQALGERLNGHTLKLWQKAGIDGRLFGSVTAKDIAEGLQKDGFTDVKKSDVRLPDGHLKTVGEFVVNVVLHADVQVDINVVIQGEMS